MDPRVPRSGSSLGRIETQRVPRCGVVAVYDDCSHVGVARRRAGNTGQRGISESI